MTSTHLWLPLQDPAAGTHVCKENTIAERNVSDLSFVYLLFKSWTDRVTHLGSLENTLGSLLTSKVPPQAAENIIIIEFGVWSKQSHILIAILKSRHGLYKHFNRFNLDCLTKEKKEYVHPVVHSLRNVKRTCMRIPRVKPGMSW